MNVTRGVSMRGEVLKTWPCEDIKTLRTVCSLLIAALVILLLSSLCVAESPAVSSMFPNEVDVPPLQCDVGTTIEFTETFQAEGQGEYAEVLQDAETEALRLCAHAKAAFQKRIAQEIKDVQGTESCANALNWGLIDVDGHPAYPGNETHPPIPAQPGVGSEFPVATQVGIYKVNVVAQLGCMSCQIVQRKIQRATFCEADAPQYRPFLEYSMVWRWESSQYTSLDGKEFGMNCLPRKEAETTTATIEAANLCHLQCPEGCVDKYFESREVTKRRWDSCYLKQHSDPDPAKERGIFYNGLSLKTTSLDEFHPNPNLPEIMCTPFVTTHTQSSENYTTMCNFIEQEPPLSAGDLAALQGVFEEEKLEPVSLFRFRCQ